MKNYLKLYRRLPAFSGTLLVFAAILYLTLAPHPLPDADLPLFPGVDKIVHVVMFAALSFVALVDTRFRLDRRLSMVAAVGIALGAAVVGGVIELLQAAMAMGRGAEWLDFAADSVGALSAVPVARLFAAI